MGQHLPQIQAAVLSLLNQLRSILAWSICTSRPRPDFELRTEVTTHPPELFSAIPECGCLHILDSNPVLAPGSAQDLTVTFTADVANGPRFHKRVLVELLSDSRLSNYPVYVDGGYAGVAGIMAFPCRLVVRDMMPGTTLHRKLFFTGIRSLVGAIPEIVTINVSDRTSQELSLNPLPSGEKQSQTRAMDVVMTTTVGTEPGRYDRTINIHFGSQRNEVQVPLTVFVIRG